MGGMFSKPKQVSMPAAAMPAPEPVKQITDTAVDKVNKTGKSASALMPRSQTQFGGLLSGYANTARKTLLGQ